MTDPLPIPAWNDFRTTQAILDHLAQPPSTSPSSSKTHTPIRLHLHPTALRLIFPPSSQPLIRPSAPHDLRRSRGRGLDGQTFGYDSDPARLLMGSLRDHTLPDAWVPYVPPEAWIDGRVLMHIHDHRPSSFPSPSSSDPSTSDLNTFNHISIAYGQEQAEEQRERMENLKWNLTHSTADHNRRSRLQGTQGHPPSPSSSSTIYPVLLHIHPTALFAPTVPLSLLAVHLPPGPSIASLTPNPTPGLAADNAQQTVKARSKASQQQQQVTAPVVVDEKGGVGLERQVRAYTVQEQAAILTWVHPTLALDPDPWAFNPIVALTSASALDPPLSVRSRRRLGSGIDLGGGQEVDGSDGSKQHQLLKSKEGTKVKEEEDLDRMQSELEMEIRAHHSLDGSWAPTFARDLFVQKWRQKAVGPPSKKAAGVLASVGGAALTSGTGAVVVPAKRKKDKEKEKETGSSSSVPPVKKPKKSKAKADKGDPGPLELMNMSGLDGQLAAFPQSLTQTGKKARSHGEKDKAKDKEGKRTNKRKSQAVAG